MMAGVELMKRTPARANLHAIRQQLGRKSSTSGYTEVPSTSTVEQIAFQ